MQPKRALPMDWARQVNSELLAPRPVYSAYVPLGKHDRSAPGSSTSGRAHFKRCVFRGFRRRRCRKRRVVAQGARRKLGKTKCARPGVWVQRFNDRNFKWLTAVGIAAVVAWVLLQRKQGSPEYESLSDIEHQLEGDDDGQANDSGRMPPPPEG